MKGRRSVPRTATRLAPVLILVVSLFAACGLGLPTNLPAPTAVSATTDEVDQITVTWNAVAGASRYYVYRSQTREPFPIAEGDYGDVPYTSTNLATFTDPTSGAETYSYRVSAVQQHTGSESPLSDVATGASMDGPIEWQNATRIGSFFTNFTTSRLAVDHTRVPPRVYALGVGTGETSVSVRRVEADGTLTQLGAAFGEVNGAYGRVADIAVHDRVIRVALVNRASGALEIWTYNEAADEFTLTATLATAAVTSRSPHVAFASGAEGVAWLAYLETDESVVTRRLDASLNETPVTASALDTNGAGSFVSQIELEADSNGAVLAFEVENRSSVEATYPTVELVAASAANGASAWTPEPNLFNGSATFTSAETPVSAIDLAVDRATGTAHIAVATGSSLYLTDDTTPPAAAINPSTFGGLPAPSPRSIGVAAHAGTVRLFYLDDNASAGVIRSTSDGGATWSLTSPDSLTADTGLISLEIETLDERIFTGWISDPDENGEGGAFVRAYQ